MKQSPLTTFTNHSDDYQKYRPGYPEAIITYLESNIGLDKEKSVADVGAGTGIFTELLLKNNYHVQAIEPNQEMRIKAEVLLDTYPDLKIINGTAENTGLEAGKVDLITVAQSFHWFDPEKTREEFKRIARPGAYVLLIWNILQDKSSFLQKYHALKNNYAKRRPHLEKIDNAKIARLLEPCKTISQEIYHSRSLHEQELLGYFRSSSYSPLEGEEGYPELVEELHKIFEEHQQNGTVKLEYDAKLYLAPLL